MIGDVSGRRFMSSFKGSGVGASSLAVQSWPKLHMLIRAKPVCLEEMDTSIRSLSQQYSDSRRWRFQARDHLLTHCVLPHFERLCPFLLTISLVIPSVNLMELAVNNTLSTERSKRSQARSMIVQVREAIADEMLLTVQMAVLCAKNCEMLTSGQGGSVISFGVRLLHVFHLLNTSQTW